MDKAGFGNAAAAVFAGVGAVLGYDPDDEPQEEREGPPV